MHCWSSLQGTWCEKHPCSLMVTLCGGLNRAKCSGSICLNDTYCWGPIDWGAHCYGSVFGGYGSESKDLLVQFTPAPQSSQIRVCIVQHLLKWTWIEATIVDLIRPRVWVIVKLAMDYCSPEELVTLQYGSFGTLSDQVKQLTQRTGCSKHPTEWAMRWQLYLDELDRRHPGWSLAWWQEWGLFLLEWLFSIASTMQRREQQCNRWRCPHQATATEDTAPVQPSVWILLGSMNEDIFGVAKDIYHGQYQLAPHAHMTTS